MRNACAEARQALLELGGLYFATSPEDLVTRGGTVSLAGDASSSVTYGDLIGTRRFLSVPEVFLSIVKEGPLARDMKFMDSMLKDPELAEQGRRSPRADRRYRIVHGVE